MSSTDDLSFDNFMYLVWNNNNEDWSIGKTVWEVLVKERPDLTYKVVAPEVLEEDATRVPEFLVWVKENW